MYLLFSNSMKRIGLGAINNTGRITLGAQFQNHAFEHQLIPRVTQHIIYPNGFRRGNLQIEPVLGHGGMLRCLTTKIIPPKPVSTEQVDNVNEDLDDVRNKLKKLQSDAESIRDEIKVLVDEWKKEGAKFSRKDQLDFFERQQATLEREQANLTTRETNLNNQRKELETKLKDQGTFTPSKVIFTPPPLSRQVQYVRPSVFNEVVDVIDDLSTSYGEPSRAKGVPVIYGHPGTGKTRLTEEASREWFNQDIAKQNSRRTATATTEPQSLANYRYGYIRVNNLSKLVSGNVEPEAAVGYAILLAMGQSISSGPHESHYYAAMDLLKMNGVNTFVLNLDEFQSKREFVRKVVRGCMGVSLPRIIPLLSGLTHANGDKFDSESGSWKTHPILLTPFDDTVEFEKNFVKAIGLSWEDYAKLGASRFLFAACGGFPRQIVVLAGESMRALKQPNINKLSMSVFWDKSSANIFEGTLNTIKGFYDKSRWHKSFTDPTYNSDHTKHEIQQPVPSIETDTMPDVIRIGVTAVLGAEVKKSDSLGKGSDRKWNSLFDAGTVSYTRGRDNEHAKPRISYFAALAICDLAEGKILPRDPELYEPMRQDFRALEAVIGASLFVRLRYEQIKGNAGTYIPLSSLRPGCHVIKDPNTEIEIQVPQENELRWVIGAHTSKLEKELKDFNVGEIARTAMQTEAVDAFSVMRGKLITRNNVGKIIASQPVAVEFLEQAKSNQRVDEEEPSTLVLSHVKEIATGMKKIVGHYEIPMLSQEELDEMKPEQQKQALEKHKKLLDDREGKRKTWPLKRTLPNEAQPLKVVRIVDILSDKVAGENLFKENSDVYNIPKLIPECVALMITTRAEYRQVLGDVLGTRTMMDDSKKA